MTARMFLLAAAAVGAFAGIFVFVFIAPYMMDRSQTRGALWFFAAVALAAASWLAIVFQDQILWSLHL